MMILTCDRVQDLLPELARGGLDGTERAALEAHLEDCAECRAEYDVVRAVSASVPAVPGALAARVLSATRARPRARRWGSPGQLAAAATLAAAVIGGALLFDGGGAPRPAPQSESEPAAAAEVAVPMLDDPVLRGGSLLGDLTEAELQALLEKMES